MFANPNKRIVLNSITHPLVKKKIMEQIACLKAEDTYEYCFVEAALLIEDHYQTVCDEFWYIYVPETLRRERLKASRGYTDEKIDSILKSQRPKKNLQKHVRIRLTTAKIWILRCHSLRNCFKCDILVAV